MKIFIGLIFTVLVIAVKAQVARQPLSVRYAGLGAYSKSFSDGFSATSNQASLASLKSPAFGLYGERRFLLNELKGYAAIVAVPTSSGTVAFQADYFGSSLFNENQLSLLYARKITQYVDLGIKFNYHTIRTGGYGTASAINFEGGVIFHLTERLHTGFHVYNPTSSKLGKTNAEKLASVYRFGMGYEASEKVFMGAEIAKQEDRPVGVNTGLQYNLHERVFLRTGISTSGNNSYVGIGLLLGFARIDLNTAYHQQLGFTPGLLLLFNIKKETKE